MNLLAESKHYIVYNEYETVILQIKQSQREIQIGDFYGNPQMAVISEDEAFCVMCGCGAILYYLREPFKEYEYHIQTEQWKEWGRSEKEVWIERIGCIRGKTVELITEYGQNIRMNVDDA
jgi:hypothetical protein